MRVFLAGLLAAMPLHAASAEMVLKREPHHLASRTTVFVSDGRCPDGMVMKVTGRSHGRSRHRGCVAMRAMSRAGPLRETGNPRANRPDDLTATNVKPGIAVAESSTAE